MSKLLKVAAAAALSLAVFSTSSMAEDPAEKAVKARKGAFQVMAAQMPGLIGTAKGQVPFDGARMTKSANAINAISMVLHPLFPEGSDMVADTAALSEVWDKPEDFNKAIAMLESASAGALAAAKAGDEGAFKKAAFEVGGACKNCHDTFRKKK